MNISEYIDSHVEGLIKIIINYTPTVISALLVLIIGLWLIKRLSALANTAMQKRDLEVSLRTFLRSLMSIGLKIVLIVTVAGMVGIGTTSFVTILGAAGLAVGLALQGSLSNFAGGVLILIFKPFKVGDSIEAQGQSGKVTEIQIFNTILTTLDKKVVILPNGVLSNKTIVNVSRSGITRSEVQLTLSQDNNIEKVLSSIEQTIAQNKNVLKEPAPSIGINKIADGIMHISIKIFCNSSYSGNIVSDLNIELKNECDKNNIKQFIPKA